MTVRRHRRYSTEFKIQLVQAYLDGEGSARLIATRHEVPHSLLMVWIKKYEAGDLTREIRSLSTPVRHSWELIREQSPVS